MVVMAPLKLLLELLFLLRLYLLFPRRLFVALLLLPVLSWLFVLLLLVSSLPVGVVSVHYRTGGTHSPT